MDTPGAVAEVIGGEEVRAGIELDGPGADALYVTPTRTVAYDEEGLLTDESVTELVHDAERVTVSEGRRKATITLSYGLEEDRSVAVPARQVDEALHPLLAGVLAARGVTEEGETVEGTYRFSELTVVVTSHRVVKHVGGAVWDEAEHEEIRFADVRDVGIEAGEVSTQLVIETVQRQERIKTPAEGARQVHADIEEALLAFHGVDSYDAFREAVAAEEEEDTTEGADGATEFAESGLDSISMSGTDGPTEPSGPAADTSGGSTEPEPATTAAGSEATGSDTAGSEATGSDTGTEEAEAAAGGEDGFAGSAFESAASRQSVDTEAVEDELRALDEALARQADLIEEQRAALAALAEELDVD